MVVSSGKMQKKVIKIVSFAILLFCAVDTGLILLDTAFGFIKITVA